MKYCTFYRENNDFSDILNDIVLKKNIKEKIKWKNHLMVCINDTDDNNIMSYVTLKFGDDLKTDIVKDRTPIMGVDYIPEKRERKK